MMQRDNERENTKTNRRIIQNLALLAVGDLAVGALGLVALNIETKTFKIAQS